MNIENTKSYIRSNIGKSVSVTVYGMRNKKDSYEGIIHAVYPNFFTIIYRGGEKSFNYRDIITKDIKLKII